MATGAWSHNFPVAVDAHPTYIDWPTVGFDKMTNALWQSVFSALDVVQKFHIAWFREYVSWGSLDGFDIVEDGGAGAFAAQGASLYLPTGNVNGNDTYVTCKAGWPKLVAPGKLVIVEWIVYGLSSVAANTIHLEMTNNATQPATETADHFGFKVINSDIYATNGDGTTQKITTTLMSVVAAPQRLRLRVVLNPGVDCKFYVAGARKVTHTLNLPDAPHYHLNMGIQTGAAASKQLTLGRVLIEKEH